MKNSNKIKKKKPKFLCRTINQNSSFRQFWISKLIIDGNNYDFGQGESCLRTDLSWHVGLRDHSVQFISIFNNLLSSIKDENQFLTQIRSLRLLQCVSTLEYNSFMVYFRKMKPFYFNIFLLILDNETMYNGNNS